MMNTSDNLTSCQTPDVHIWIPIFLSFLFCIGFLMNCISLYIFWFRIKQWNSLMILQFNLAISNAIITPVAPLIIIYSLTHHWPYGTFVCQFKVFLFSAHIYGSIYFLTLISIHRYITVVHRVKITVFNRNSFITKVCLVVWGCLCLQGFPFFFTMKKSDVDGATKCLSFHQNELAFLFFVWNGVIIFTGLLIPFGIAIVCYSLLIRYILNVNPINSLSKVMMSKSIQTVSVSLVIFIICYVPIHIPRTIGVTINLFFPSYCSLLERMEVAYYITWMLLETNCCIDPVLYCFASKKFKKVFMNSFVYMRSLRGDQPDTMDNARHVHVESGSGISSGNPQYEPTPTIYADVSISGGEGCE
ncbi:P2Y purinoceptor 4-like [Ascaphus truei]|uniref:P2Y purinoceptor 4-like n=1 Tax=Ascaphus truei TaxID=8439 RepID=UPI003F59354B